MKNHKNRKTFFFISYLLFAISVAWLAMGQIVPFSLGDPAVEALAACEIVSSSGTVKLECVGEEGTCSASAMGHTLVCSGKKETN